MGLVRLRLQRPAAAGYAISEATKPTTISPMNLTSPTTMPTTMAPAALNIWNYECSVDYVHVLQWYNTVLQAQFKSKYPGSDAVVVPISYEDYEAKYTAAFAGRSGAPDIFYGKVPYWVGGMHVGEPMPDYLASKMDQNGVEVTKLTRQWQGKYYGVDMESDLGCLFLFINTDHFKEVGLDPDVPPANFDQLLAYAKQLTTPKHFGFGVRYSGGQTETADKWLPFLHSWGGRLYSEDGTVATGYVNGPEALESFTYMTDMLLKDKVAGYVGLPEDAFSRGQDSMIFREPWYTGYLQISYPDIHFKVYVVPPEKAAAGYSLLFSAAYTVYAFGQNKDLAWKWLDLLTTPDNDLAQAKTEGYLPTLAVNYNSDYLTTRLDYDAIKEATARPAGPYYDHPAIDQISMELGGIIQEACTGAKPPKDALDEAATTIDAILTKAAVYKKGNIWYDKTTDQPLPG